MKQATILIPFMLGCSLAATDDMPPGDITPYEQLSPQEHASLYLSLVSHLYYALIPKMDSVVDAETAAQARDEIIALHRRLNMAIDHMELNPDTRLEIVTILRNHPERRKQLENEQAIYEASAQRCRDTGLIPDMPTIRRVTIPQDN